MQKPTYLSDSELVARAWQARELASAPYSHFLVGAALLASDGRVFTGCNVESSSYGLSICAERVALTKAISEGAREFVTIAVVAQGKGTVSPCGACRQLLHDYAPNLRVLLSGQEVSHTEHLLKELLPLAFSAEQLNK
jgi:cytidine deaminase